MARRTGYGQFCPVAKAAEVVAERWTPLILREMINGSRRFNEIRRGVPLISTSLLSQRLRELEDAGVIHRHEEGGRSVEYELSEAGRELQPIIEALGFWGARWLQSRVRPQDLDASLLMWDIRRRIDLQRLPAERRIVVRVDLRGAERGAGRWWLVIEEGEVDLCLKDPGYPEDLLVSADLAALIAVWSGQRSLDAATRAGDLSIQGPWELAAKFARSLKLSVFAGQTPA